MTVYVRRKADDPPPRAVAPRAGWPVAWSDPHWVSRACAHPDQPQADSVQKSRRHPLAGARPQCSGYCVLPSRCTCWCHEAGKDHP